MSDALRSSCGSQGTVSSISKHAELVGQQYPTDTGSIDILAVGKDRKTLLVVELKKGRASDVVVGQTLGAYCAASLRTARRFAP